MSPDKILSGAAGETEYLMVPLQFNCILPLVLPQGCNGQEYSQYNSQEGCEEHPEFFR